MKSISHKIFLYAGILVTAVITACSKSDDEAPLYNEENLAPLTVEFDNIVGERTLQLNSATYTNASGEPFTVSLIQYYISNIKAAKSDGTVYTVPQDSSYFLITGDKSTRFARVKVPEGDYTSLTFTVGVDSLRNTMPVDKRTGVLDPSGSHDGAGMYWGWNSGYIFFKLEGTSPAVTSAGDPTGKQQFKYHIGGFGGYSVPTINNIKAVTIDLQTAGTARVRKDRNCNIHLFADLLKVFNGSTRLSIANHPSVMFSDYSVNIANNYQNMFRHDHTEN